MIHKFFAGGAILFSTAAGAGLVNADFEAQTGTWGHGEGPPGWVLDLDGDHQMGVVEAVNAARSGSHVFYFTDLDTGFGANKLEQCAPLPTDEALALSVYARTDHAHADLRVRLRMDFFADPDCTADSANSGSERIETDFALDAERFGDGGWRMLASEQRLISELGDDVTHMRVSLRARDRSNDGQPTDPPLIIWFDDVSTASVQAVLPAGQRDALRDLYLQTGGEHWKRNAGWMGPEGTECQWQGVQCSQAGDAITGLDLAANGLSGELPGGIAALDSLRPGGLDLCWNALDAVPELTDLDRWQLGGGIIACQQPDLERFHPGRTGHLFQPAGRTGEGFTLQMLSASSAALWWQTYYESGEPLWLHGTGRVNDRVMRFDELFVTRRENNETIVTRVARATLVFRDCDSAEFRYEVDWDSDVQVGTPPPTEFPTGGRRELRYLDNYSPCARDADISEPAQALTGAWFDPAQAGEGFSFAPVVGQRILTTWMAHDQDGVQEWLIGVGHPVSGGFAFDEIHSVSGGNFSGELIHEDLDIVLAGSGEVDWSGDHPRFQFFPATPDRQQRDFELHGFNAGPELLASSGHPLRLEMAPDDVEELYARDVRSDERLPGHVDYAGVAGQPSPVALRFRGRSSRAFPKKSLNIRHELTQPLLFGSDRMNLNAMWTDPAMIRESLAFELFRELGQPASRTRHFDVWLNGVYEGLHVHIDRVDERLLAAHGLNPDGTLVRDDFRDRVNIDPEVDRPSAFGFDIEAIEPERRADFLAQRFDFRNQPQWDHLVELVAWVHDTPAGPDYEQGFAARVDVDNFIDWLVLHWLIGDRDSFADDYWLYLDHEDPDARWMFIPWDKDLTFGSFSTHEAVANDWFDYERPLQSEWANELVRKFLDTPALRDAAHARLLELMQDYFPEAYFARRVNELAEIVGDSQSIAPSPAAFHHHARQHHSAPGRFDDHLEVITDYIALRYRFMQQRINPGFGADLQAVAEISAGTHDPVFLTDATGYTFMSLKPEATWPEDALLEALVVQDETISGIDREWILESSAELGEVEVTVYYRNAPEDSSRENWWTLDFEPVSRQDEMLMHTSQRVLIDTRVNPYSNKAVANLQLGSGRELFVLMLPD